MTFFYFRGSEALAAFELMFSNCYLYNKPTDDVTIMCQEVESYFKQIVKKVPPVEVPLELPEAGTQKTKAPKGTPAKNGQNKKVRPPPVPKMEPNHDDSNPARLAGGDKSAIASASTSSNSIPVPKQEPIQANPQLLSRRRGIKRPDSGLTGENEKKRARKRKRWWSGCKQYIDFLFHKKHEGYYYVLEYRCGNKINSINKNYFVLFVVNRVVFVLTTNRIRIITSIIITICSYEIRDIFS